MTGLSLSSRLNALRDLDTIHVERRHAYHRFYMRTWRAKRKAERERLLSIAAAAQAFVAATEAA